MNLSVAAADYESEPVILPPEIEAGFGQGLRALAAAGPAGRLGAFGEMCCWAARRTAIDSLIKTDVVARLGSTARAAQLDVDAAQKAMSAAFRTIEAKVEAAEAETINDISTSKLKKPPTTFSASDLMKRSFAPIKYIVPEYIAEGCTLQAGRPKIGKSWLMLDAALAVASGGVCLGQRCAVGDVLYLALEDNPRRLQRRLRKLLVASDPVPDRLHLATDWPRAEEGIAAIKAWLDQVVNPLLVVVDVLAMFRSTRGDKQSLYESDYGALKGLQALAGEAGVAIVVVHHTRKGAADVDPFDKVSGTLGLSGAADTVMILDRDGGGATLYGRGRDVEEFDKAVIFDTVSCRWSIQGEASEVRRSDERSVILDVLKEATEPLSPSDLSAATSFQNNNVRQLLFKMVKDGQVVKLSGRARYVHPARSDLVTPSPVDDNDNDDDD